ncbi:MAG TPA: VOC family protein [Gammaproteobacteria bacterium]|nr:VOC family protein [Gammaproteobacteria bacterium]
MIASETKTEGIHHVGLTVPKLDAAREFFIHGLGFGQIGEMPDYPAVFVSDGTVLITLWQAEDPESAVPFDRHRVIGLHHFALKVGDAMKLDGLHDKLSHRDDVEIEFAPESLGGGPTKHMMCRIPGNIRLEVIAPAAA